MVKVHKMFCVDININDWLKGQNASSLVNELLRTHMQKTIKPYAHLSIDEKKLLLTKMEIMREAEKKVEEIDNANR